MSDRGSGLARQSDWYLVLVLCLGLGGCSIVRAPTAEELAALEDPPPTVTAKVDALLPGALAWYDSVEAELLPQGRVLTEREREQARRLGVAQPERLRVVVLETFPMPEDPELLEAARAYGLGSPYAGGRAMGYVIMLKPRYANDSTILAHEFVHIGQHDRLGREAFLRRYMVELEMLGYARAPLELEAYQRQDAIE